MDKLWYRWSPLSACEPDNVDLKISKSTPDPSGKTGNNNHKLWCESWLTTEHEDSDKDIMLADEVDLDFYKANGFMCHEHPSLALTLVGRNVRAWVDEHPSGVKGVRQRGYFYGNDPDGRKLYEKMIMLSEAEEDPDRHLGTSAEGKSLEAIPRPGGGFILKKNKIWGTAVTHRPKNSSCRFSKTEYDIACSLHEAAKRGYLRQHLEVLLKNLDMAESLFPSNTTKSTGSQISVLKSKYALTDNQAELLVRKLAELENNWRV